jgi:succinyl-CoA synthetase beta subunit
MDLYEYQAKELFRRWGIPVPTCYLASSLEEVQALLERTGWEEAVLKIQVHAGGRGKAGGIRHAKDQNGIRQAAQALLGFRFTSPQTGPEGIIADKILLDTPVAIRKEYYLAVVLDRTVGAASLIASPAGGMDIEEIAVRHPSQLLVETVPEEGALWSFQLRRIAAFMGWHDAQEEQGIHIVRALVAGFFESEALITEINPLVETRDGELLALDAKMSVDDDALFRHPDLIVLDDPSQLTGAEQRARALGLAYVSLAGNIGCMVNGAGLAMATMDLIRVHGGEPANFLDVGGGASEEKVTEGFSLLLADPGVSAILVNIFGGIMNCETIARALRAAVMKGPRTLPIVLHMEGTNVDAARALLAASDQAIHSVEGLDEAALLAVTLARGAHGHSGR